MALMKRGAFLAACRGAIHQWAYAPQPRSMLRCTSHSSEPVTHSSRALAEAGRWYAAAAAPNADRDGAHPEQLRAAVVGSGPAGMYTAQRLLKFYGDKVKVDILDRLPTPFGLVRSGVAADHADTKNVVNQFDSILADPRVRYFGNVEAGKHVTLPKLRDMYHAVVLAYGTEADRQLGIPGEHLPGVFSAREFVWWLNGHPDCASLPVDLSRVRSVAILGLGNVALDCARLLLKAPDGPLAATDISGSALQELRRSTVEEVHIIGRRGIAQAQFTGKELKEILFEVPGIRTVVRPEDLKLSTADSAELAGSRQKKRTVELISKAAATEAPRGAAAGAEAIKRELHFRFLRSPVEVVAGPGGAAGTLRLEKNSLSGGQDGSPQRAKGTGEFEDLPVDLVLTCIGYRGLPAEGLPFDERSGTIPNTHGKIDGPEAVGVYAAGWVARGPSGKIGSNLADANDVVEMIDGDLGAGALSRPDPSDLETVLREAGVAFVDCEGWRRIDQAELAAGRSAGGKVREKFLYVDSMIDAASSGGGAAEA